MEPDPDRESFGRLLDALRPFLNELVIVGGWAHRLYRWHSDAILPSHEPLFTTDTDIAIPSNAPLPHEGLLERLRAHGFVEDFMGEDHPPVTHYRLGHEQSGFYAEFLTPLVGGGGRPGKQKGHTVLLGGVVAQELRYLDMLLVEPWSITVRDPPSDAEPFSVKVPNPVAYIAQKLLVLKKRKPADRPKDLLYIHDTVELFGGSLAQLKVLWQTTMRAQVGSIAVNVEKLARTYFRQVTDEIRDAARVATGRNLEPGALRLLCATGLEMIFSGEPPTSPKPGSRTP
jgi:hypothetical protein